MKSAWSEDIKIGDLIILAENNFLSVGIYAGRGPTQTVQYFSLSSLAFWLKRGSKKCWKNYINSYYTSRVSKFSPETLTEEWKEVYYTAKEKLKI